MSDNPNKRGREDRARVNVHESHELRYWTGKFGCTQRQLREAVDAVGVMAKDVAAHLGFSPQPRRPRAAKAKRRPASEPPAGADAA